MTFFVALPLTKLKWIIQILFSKLLNQDQNYEDLLTQPLGLLPVKNISHEYADKVGLEPNPGGPVKCWYGSTALEVPDLICHPCHQVPVEADPVAACDVHRAEGEGDGPD